MGNIVTLENIFAKFHLILLVKKRTKFGMCLLSTMKTKSLSLQIEKFSC